MRKLAMTGVLAAATLFAQGVRADDAAKERQEAKDATSAEMKQEGREARTEMRETGREARQEARETGDRMGSRARSEQNQLESQRNRETRTAQAGQQEKKHPLFDGKENFDIEGKIQKVSQNSITLSREELPAATLTVSRNTKIELDGEQVSAARLKAGQEVKASFNLKGDKPEAVEIKAEKAD